MDVFIYYLMHSKSGPLYNLGSEALSIEWARDRALLRVNARALDLKETRKNPRSQRTTSDGPTAPELLVNHAGETDGARLWALCWKPEQLLRTVAETKCAQSMECTSDKTGCFLFFGNLPYS